MTSNSINPMNHLLLIPLLLCTLFFKPSFSDPRATEAAIVCSNATSTPGAETQTFATNFLAAMDAVTPPVVRQGHAAVMNGTFNETVYAFGECMKDLDQTDCSLCFSQCKAQILRCLPFQIGTRGGRLFYDGCYLRYDDYNFFNESLSAQDRTVCAANDVGSNGTGNGTVFRANAMELVRNLSVMAPANDGFFVGSVNLGNSPVYGLAQCWEFVNGSACVDCLQNAVSKIDSCLPKEEGRVMNAGCYLRYSTVKFYNISSSAPPIPSNGGSRKLAIILAVTSSVLAFVLIVAAGVFFTKSKLMKKRRERKQLGALADVINNSKLNYSYECLEKATNYFHLANKLGQGASGTVYKGVLGDGKIVAVKRLFFNTRHWVDHFFNEVNLISGIHHKNLVKLLGCSVTGPESLLVYEYIPNQSLHDYIFVRKDLTPLSWELRYNIILGTAKGLSYLHEESTLRIIHRDIKLNNVLLDEDFTPKIADFGLARLFPEDQSHISTAVAGTFGYMAPEYVVHGKLTEKADVYSFGVLVIEVICGKRNTSFFQDCAVSIMQMVWNHYGNGKLCEVVDPALNGNFREEEASRLLQIGLLCVQASAEMRPSMSMVVTMLTNNHELPEPSQPPFLNPGSCDITQNTKTFVFESQRESDSPSPRDSASTQSWVEPR